MSKTKIVNFKFNEKTLKLTDDLQQRIGLSTRAAVIRRALVLLDVVSKGHEEGKELILRKGDEVERIIIV